MHPDNAQARPIRIVSAGHVFFAAVMAWLGVMGLANGNFVEVWQPMPNGRLAAGAWVVAESYRRRNRL